MPFGLEIKINKMEILNLIKIFPFIKTKEDKNYQYIYIYSDKLKEVSDFLKRKSIDFKVIA
jgi:hypothetical protein